MFAESSDFGLVVCWFVNFFLFVFGYFCYFFRHLG